MTNDPEFLRRKHEAGDDYETYLEDDPGRAASWAEIHEQVALDPAQAALVGGFTRTMNVLCLSGIWCGDCVAQGPMFARIADASDLIRLSWLDRDEHRDLAEAFAINAGLRVPTVIFCSEDFELVGYLGDRTLSRYRALAARQTGASCQLPGAEQPEDELRATLQDWINEFERVQLLLRLSPRLRQRHGD
ncbi:MAG: thioredoxin family protein [Planctomycetota bacterium]|nr:thioredoxin family protein [Planctomycetota bacterium]MED5508610.1 thioredoxin family protein [Planctomycetota bacterium]MED6306469.1 thioredoxin family protein [Planctomycetota bacterium]